MPVRIGERGAIIQNQQDTLMCWGWLLGASKGRDVAVAMDRVMGRGRGRGRSGSVVMGMDGVIAMVTDTDRARAIAGVLGGAMTMGRAMDIDMDIDMDMDRDRARARARARTMIMGRAMAMDRAMAMAMNRGMAMDMDRAMAMIMGKGMGMAMALLATTHFTLAVEPHFNLEQIGCLADNRASKSLQHGRHALLLENKLANWRRADNSDTLLEVALIIDTESKAVLARALEGTPVSGILKGYLKHPNPALLQILARRLVDESVTLEIKKDTPILNGQQLLDIRLQPDEIKRFKESFQQALQDEFPPISAEALETNANVSASALRDLNNRNLTINKKAEQDGLHELALKMRMCRLM